MHYSDSIEVTFLIPCYNEARNVTGALETARKIMEGKGVSYEILVVDDASTDRTSEVVEDYAKTHPEMPIALVRNPKNRGLGHNYLEGASRGKGRYYFLINGDNDIPVDDLGSILEQRGKADVIIPYLDPDTRPLFRQLISRTFTLIVNVLGGHRLRYYNGPVLHLRANVIRFRPNTKGFGYQAELLCRALREGCTYHEVPFRSLAKTRLSSAFRLSNVFRVLGSLLRITRDRIFL